VEWPERLEGSQTFAPSSETPGGYVGQAALPVSSSIG
jgi:hypothetical protein